MSKTCAHGACIAIAVRQSFYCDQHLPVAGSPGLRLPSAAARQAVTEYIDGLGGVSTRGKLRELFSAYAQATRNEINAVEAELWQYTHGTKKPQLPPMPMGPIAEAFCTMVEKGTRCTFHMGHSGPHHYLPESVVRERQASAEAVPMLLHCPQCGERHVDEGEFATKAHHTHACQECGHCWRPAVVHTVGVRFLPGFKNTEKYDPVPPACSHPGCTYAFCGAKP